jgi:ubiquinone/menaquinone biosynthesis C-methylase UbiE
VAADAYERHLVPALFSPWAADLVARAAPRAGDRVLDVACGTGIVARTVAPVVGPSGSVTALDVNAHMLTVARRVCADLRPPIRWRQASAADTGLPTAAFDVLLCQQGLQFMGDRLAAVREMYRLTAPGGRLAVSVWCDRDHPAYQPFISALTRHLPDAPDASGFVRAIFSLADATELHDLLARAGFRKIDVSRHTCTVRFASARAWAQAFLTSNPIPALAAVPAPTADALLDEVAGQLHHLVDGAGLAFEIGANFALAHR